jgi:large subunit ribosomal protein L17
MRHRVRTGRLSRTGSHRLAMYRNLVTSLLDHERVETTEAKAKGVRRLAERMITLGKRGDLHARRRALRVIRRREVAAKVFDDLAVRYRNRPGGYTRILKLRHRPGDGAPLSIVELVEGEAAAAEKAEAPKRGRRAKRAAEAAKAEEKQPAVKKGRAKRKAAEAGPSEKPARKKTASKKKPARKSSE